MWPTPQVCRDSEHNWLYHEISLAMEGSGLGQGEEDTGTLERHQEDPAFYSRLLGEERSWAGGLGRRDSLGQSWAVL